MITAAFPRESSLQYRIRSLEKELESFKTGEKYVKMKEMHRKETDALRHEIERLKKELAQARRETKDVRDKWFATCDDIITEEDRNARKALEEILKLKQKCFDIDMKRHDEKAALVDAYEEKLAEKDRIIGELKKRLAHTDALLGRDGTNTGIPTSQTPAGKKKVIPNSRRSTGRKKEGSRDTGSMCWNRRPRSRSMIQSLMRSTLPWRNALSAVVIHSFIQEKQK